LRCRLHHTASNSTTRQSGLQSAYDLGWTCVSPIFADVARRSTLVVCTTLSANRPLAGRSSTSHAERSRCSSFRSCWGPSAKEPVGLVRQDGKRPDGLTMIPLEGGRSSTWDVTVVCTTADSYIDLAVQVLAVWRRWQPLARRRNTPLWRVAMISSRSRSRAWVLSMSRPILFCTIWVGKFRP